MKAEEITALLNVQIARLDKLTGEEISGFALLVPPEGAPIEFLTMGAGDNKGFFGLVADRIKGSLDLSGGAVGTGFGRR